MQAILTKIPWMIKFSVNELLISMFLEDSHSKNKEI